MREVVELTKELVRIPSMHSRPEEIARCVDRVVEYLEAAGASVRRMEHAGVPSAMALPAETSTPVVLMSHVDVVDAPEELFTPVERDGKLFGRGSLDDKYAVALSLVLFKNRLEKLRSQGRDQSDMPFGVLITGDEEVGGANGVRPALKQFKAGFGLALDGGDVRNIVAKEKGIYRLRLTSKGRTAHGSTPWLGVNAVERLMDDYRKIQAFFHPSAFGYDPEDHWHRTLNLGAIRAGQSINQVPDKAVAELDIRFTEKDDMPALHKEMQAAIAGELTLISKSPMFYAGETPYLDLLRQASPDSELGVEHGASDARYLSDHGIPGVVWGVDGDRSFHAPDEHIDLASLETLYRRLDDFFDRVAAFRDGEAKG
ncbi:MAG: M20 family metallopeptidase [Desulfococcaceae bacterium]